MERLKMENYELKAGPKTFWSIAEGEKVAAYLNDHNIVPGDIVTFNEWDPKKQEATGRYIVAKLTHADITNPLDFYDEESINEHGMKLLGLSKSNAPVIIAPDKLVNAKAIEETFKTIKQGRRVDLRLADRNFKHGGAIIYHEIDDNKNYTGDVAIRLLERVTPFNPFEYYSPKQVKTSGLIIMGWKDTLDKKLD